MVECVEQRQRVDEQKFNVDLDDLSMAGGNKVRFDSNRIRLLEIYGHFKRRRSMLPKHVTSYQPEMNSSNGDQEEMEVSSGEFNPIQRLSQCRMLVYHSVYRR